MRVRQIGFGGSGFPDTSLWVRGFLAAWLVILLGLMPATAADTGRTAEVRLASSANTSATHRIAVIGDSLAQDLWNGLHKLYRDQEKVEIIRFTQVSTGLVRDDVYDWHEALREFVIENEFEIAIVLMGGNDRQPIRANGRRLKRNSDAWSEEYAKRVANLINIVKPEARAFYWLGLPIVRSNRMARDYRRFNKIYRAQADALGIKFINTWSLYEDENGAYTSFGPDAKGVNRRLRKDDGMHFTVAGKLRFALDIVGIIRRDLSAAESGTSQDGAAVRSGG